MQKPSIGRIVIVNTTALGVQNNGADEAPAVITRVWNDTMVNVRVLLDGDDTPWKTSVSLFETEDAAREAGQGFACWWPPRV